MDTDPDTLTDRRRLNAPLALAAVLAALLIGLLLGGGLGGLKGLFGGAPDTVASSALQSMRAQNRLVPFVARFVSVTSSKQQSLGGLVSSERTLILPGDVRYELDLAKLKDGDVTWDKGSQTRRARAMSWSGLASGRRALGVATSRRIETPRSWKSWIT